MSKKSDGWKKKIKEHYPKLFIAALALLAVVLVFGQNVKFVFITLTLIAAASLSTFYHNFFRSPINFELIKFSTILTAVSYGAAAGIAVGIISTIASKIISEKLDHTAIASLAGIIIIAVAASIFQGTDIVLLGIILVAVYHLITAPMQLAFGGALLYGIIYIGSNLFFNIILFTRIAPLLIKLM